MLRKWSAKNSINCNHGKQMFFSNDAVYSLKMQRYAIYDCANWVGIS